MPKSSPSNAYAQNPPENNDHFKPDLSHALSSWTRVLQWRMQKGTTVEANPKNNVGGCMVFQ
ncbi:MAG: hypothetical protein IPL23_24900 [Saprospiraceae bacterium]|nr:hypothetical protein [Saprospiraceae bacterium]